MEEIIEQYGIGLLQILGGVAVIMLWRTFFCDDGILRQICLQYLSGICG
ncbi:MAG: hypothetical protein PUJ55_08950 [Clostridiales bacterium]|nr:hypothetical protein [Roseburia sp.]MDD7637052.1 hypothetical protein [Clostridiales bacterium]MDY4111216.1 hypothetical protein [Roseburia sp.]